MSMYNIFDFDIGQRFEGRRRQLDGNEEESDKAERLKPEMRVAD